MPVLMLIVALSLIAGIALVLILKLNGEGRWLAGVVAAVAGFLLLLVTLLTSFTQVPANSVAIVTTFGKAHDKPLTPGPHFTAPWAEVTTFTTRVQPIHRDGKNCVKIRFKGGGSGCVDSTIRAKVEPNDVVMLWRNYKSLEDVQTQLVRSETNNAFQAVYGGFDPEDAINGANYRAISGAIVVDVNERLRKYGVDVESISISAIDPDKAVSDRINNLIVAEAQTKVATQHRLTAIQEQLANKTAALALTPLTLHNKCLDITDEAVRRDKAMPATWTCSGSPTAIVGVR